ncbi:hypothetical protein SPI_04063 [Niveomyces insectorum RCEF 264]|uniref:Protein kinase-like domain protein n=1 Tax=Niveomyces insectorum RCEF 264 TaxID=1081102 RepID=A0A167VEE5_9HYPO|nr:hypothetical protein SPI_04063 [Niveomyces insectorum RCEF 264]
MELLPSGNRVKKFPHPNVSRYDKKWVRKHIQRETDIYRRLPWGHDRLVRVFSPAEDNDSDNHEPSIVLESMPNGNLRDFLGSHPTPVIQQLQ